MQAIFAIIVIFRINTMLRDASVIMNDVSNYRVIKDRVAEFLFGRFKSLKVSGQLI